MLFTAAEIVLMPSKTQQLQIRCFPFPTFNRSFHLNIPLYQALPNIFLLLSQMPPNLRHAPLSENTVPHRPTLGSSLKGSNTQIQDVFEIIPRDNYSISPFKTYRQIGKKVGTREIKYQHWLNMQDHPRNPVAKWAFVSVISAKGVISIWIDILT